MKSHLVTVASIFLLLAAGALLLPQQVAASYPNCAAEGQCLAVSYHCLGGSSGPGYCANESGKCPGNSGGKCVDAFATATCAPTGPNGPNCHCPLPTSQWYIYSNACY